MNDKKMNRHQKRAQKKELKRFWDKLEKRASKPNGTKRTLYRTRINKDINLDEFTEGE